MPSLELIGLILAVLGLIVALGALIVGFWHVIEIRQQVGELQKQSNAAKEHASALDTLRRELSTRYIGHFPEFVHKVIEILAGAKSEIVICCDFPAYCAFSDPRAFLRYRHILEQKLLDGIPVHLTCFNREQRIKFSRAQFLGPSISWAQWKQDDRNRSRLKTFLASQKSGLQADLVTADEFIELMERGDAQMIEGGLLAGAQVRQVSYYLPLYYWLVDKEIAVFSIPSVSETTLEHGFCTIDQKLLTAFDEMRQSINVESQAA